MLPGRWSVTVFSNSFSVGFVLIRDNRDGHAPVRTEAALREVSLVGFPAYAGADPPGHRVGLDPGVLLYVTQPPTLRRRASDIHQLGP